MKKQLGWLFTRWWFYLIVFIYLLYDEVYYSGTSCSLFYDLGYIFGALLFFGLIILFFKYIFGKLQIVSK